MSLRAVGTLSVVIAASAAQAAAPSLVPVTDPTLRQRLVAALTAAAHDQNDTRATKPIGIGAGKAIGW